MFASSFNSSAFGKPLEGWSRQIISKGDVHLETFERGSGLPVLMHPSLGRWVYDYEALGNHLAEAGYRVILINPRSIGASTGPTEGLTMQDLGNDVWMVADALELDRVYMLGVNFGNRVSRTVSALQPDRIIGLVLLAAGGEVEPDKEAWKNLWLIFDPSLSPEQHREAVQIAMFADGNDPSAFIDGWNPAAAKYQAEAVQRTDFAPLYEGGTAPALIIQGLEDKIAPPQNAFNFVTERPNARLVALPNVGHAMLPEAPKPIADAVLNFLSDMQP